MINDLELSDNEGFFKFVLIDPNGFVDEISVTQLIVKRRKP